MKHGTLSHEQARFFRDQGYYRLSSCYDLDEVSETRQFISEEANININADDVVNPNNKLYGLYDRNPELIDKIVGKQALIGALVSLLGPNILLVKNRHNHATINNRKGAPAEGMHRDILQPNRGLITAAIYL